VPCPYPKEHCRETALPSPLYHSGAAGIDMNQAFVLKLLNQKQTTYIMDNHLIAKIVIFSVSIPCTLYIAYAAKVALNINLDLFGAGHTPAKE
jgi:hypothetical protein